MQDDASEKPHDATPKRKEDFRKKGRFPKARDAGAVVAISAVLLALLGTSSAWHRALSEMFIRTHGDLGAFKRGESSNIGWMAASSLAVMAGPAIIAAVISGVLVGFGQAGMRFDVDILKPKFENMNPISRMKTIFSPKKALFETTLAFLKVAVIGSISYMALADEIPRLIMLAPSSVHTSVTVIGDTVLRLIFKALAGLAVLTAIDYTQSRMSLRKEMMMSHQEVKEEMKQQDGDPRMKGKRRARARDMSKRRMMQDVKQAEVIITNPTHVAVALRYKDSDPAPMVVAKGHDEVALAIRAEARKHGIPIVESRALARALDADVRIGDPITAAHFQAVAQVLAFVYRVLGKKPAA